FGLRATGGDAGQGEAVLHQVVCLGVAQPALVRQLHGHVADLAAQRELGGAVDGAVGAGPEPLAQREPAAQKRAAAQVGPVAGSWGHGRAPGVRRLPASSHSTTASPSTLTRTVADRPWNGSWASGTARYESTAAATDRPRWTLSRQRAASQPASASQRPSALSSRTDRLPRRARPC